MRVSLFFIYELQTLLQLGNLVKIVLLGLLYLILLDQHAV